LSQHDDLDPWAAADFAVPALSADLETARSNLYSDSHPDAPPEGERWSSWDGAQHGPTPRPAWVITDLGAVDQDLGILKTGKEADVHVLKRWVPRPSAAAAGRQIHAAGADGPQRSVLMAAKRYRSGQHRLFHRDAGYLEGRRVRRSREMRAMARRTEFGKELISSQWAFAEFAALEELWGLGLPVPYPVQIDGTELLMEFVGDGPVAAPRLAQTRPANDQLQDVFEQCRRALSVLAGRGWAHGDLSAYNLLLHGERVVFIDWPQIVDIIGNPQGPDFLLRDVHNLCSWFRTRGLAVDEDELFGDLMAQAAARW